MSKYPVRAVAYFLPDIYCADAVGHIVHHSHDNIQYPGVQREMQQLVHVNGQSR